MEIKCDCGNFYRFEKTDGMKRGESESMKGFMFTMDEDNEELALECCKCGETIVFTEPRELND